MILKYTIKGLLLGNRNEEIIGNKITLTKTKIIIENDNKITTIYLKLIEGIEITNEK